MHQTVASAVSIVTPAGARGSRRAISGLLRAEAGLGWAFEWVWRPLWPHPGSFPQLGEGWAEVGPSTAPLLLGPPEGVITQALPWYIADIAWACVKTLSKGSGLVFCGTLFNHPALEGGGVIPGLCSALLPKWAALPPKGQPRTLPHSLPISYLTALAQNPALGPTGRAGDRKVLQKQQHF